MLNSMRARHCNSRRRERSVRRPRVALLANALARSIRALAQPATRSRRPARLGARRDPGRALPARLADLERGHAAGGAALRLRSRALVDALGRGAALLDRESARESRNHSAP